MQKVSANAEVIGFFDYIEDGYAFGWAYHQNQLEQRVSIEIVCGSKTVGRGLANVHRGDIATAGIGDGSYAFKIPLSYELQDSEVHSLIAREERTKTILQGGPKEFPATTNSHGFELISRSEGALLFAAALDDVSLGITDTHKRNMHQVFQLCSLLQETGNLAEARFAWGALATKTKHPAILSCKVAETFMMEAQYDKALEHYKSAASSDLGCVWAHLGISAAHNLRGELVLARQALDVAIALEPTNKVARKYFVDFERRDNPIYFNEDGLQVDFYHLADLLVPCSDIGKIVSQPDENININTSDPLEREVESLSHAIHLFQKNLNTLNSALSKKML
jgi:tetratricopeptide (TPR) repeat protein